jgi:uncharacterized membrane protein
MNIYKIIIPRSIIPLLILAIALNVSRIIIWGKFSFAYILWNIFLAFIPFIISSLLLSFSKTEKFNKVIFFAGIFFWLLFIPNAPYIVTDFIHLGEIHAVPVIFDTFLLFCSASLGLILGFYSLFHIEQIVRVKYSQKVTRIIMGLVIFLISFGMYLGRFLRFNSWDIFINHTSLVKNIWKVFSESSPRIEVYLYTLLFFLFLVLSYKSWKYSNNKNNEPSGLSN